MFPAASRRCLLCSGPPPLPAAGPLSFARRRSAVPAPAAAEPRPSLDNNPTVVEPLDVPSACPMRASSKAPVYSELKPYEEVPGPKGLPFLGSLLDYMGNGPYKMNKLHLAIIDRFREFGPIFKETLVGNTHVHIIEPDDVKEVIRNEGPTPRRITLDAMVAYRKMRKRNIGMGNLQGEDWRRLRVPFNQLVFKPEQVNSYLPKIENCSDDFVALMRQLKTPDGDVPDFTTQIQRWTLEIMGSIVLDRRIGCMERHPSPTAEQIIASAIAFISGLGDLMYSVPLYKIGIYNDTWRNFVAAQDFFHEYMLSYVREAIDRMSRDVHEFNGDQNCVRGIREATFLETLIAMHSNSSPDDICDLLSDLLIGAVDTTSSLFTFVMYNLARNPACQEKVYDEISRVLAPGEPITPEILQMTPYLKACVKETMRTHPTIDGTSRILDRDIGLSGYNIPANTIIRLHAVAGMMSEYVPEPEKFQPERWLRAADKSIMANPFLSIVFGVGFRGCLGKRLAEQQTYIGIIKLLQNFRFEWPHKDISMEFQITSRPDIPMQPKVIDRLKSP